MRAICCTFCLQVSFGYYKIYEHHPLASPGDSEKTIDSLTGSNTEIVCCVATKSRSFVAGQQNWRRDVLKLAVTQQRICIRYDPMAFLITTEERLFVAEKPCCLPNSSLWHIEVTITEAFLNPSLFWSQPRNLDKYKLARIPLHLPSWSYLLNIQQCVLIYWWRNKKINSFCSWLICSCVYWGVPALK